MNFFRIFEGMGIALDSLRANKVRAALTILGVAIGVMVVIAMASAITGINRSVSSQLETLGPKTFFVQRFFQGGLNISDGSDELSPWRKNPWLKVEEARMLARLATVQDVTWRENTNGPVVFGDVNLASVQVVGFSPAWVRVDRRHDHRGPELHRPRGGIQRAGGGDQRQAGRGPDARPRSDRQEDQGLRPALRGHRPLRRGQEPLRRQRHADGHDSPLDVYQGGGLLEGLDGHRGQPHGDGHGRGDPGRGDRRHARHRGGSSPGRRTISPW